MMVVASGDGSDRRIAERYDHVRYKNAGIYFSELFYQFTVPSLVFYCVL